MRKLAASAVLAAAAGSANADVVDLMIFSITATGNDTGATVSQTFMIDPDANNDGEIVWSLDAPLSFGDLGGLEAATIRVTDGGGSRGAGAQSVVADFSVLANSQNTSYQIASGIVSFGTISASSATAFASAAVTLVDTLGDGATLTPGANGGYNALLNNGAIIFDDLFVAGSPLSVAPGVGAGNFSEDTGSFLPTGIDVSSISAEWDFSLSSFDSATGTSTFTIVPAPASAALIGLGGLAATRRRR